MPGTRPGMTVTLRLNHLNGSEHSMAVFDFLLFRGQLVPHSGAPTSLPACPIFALAVWLRPDRAGRGGIMHFTGEPDPPPISVLTIPAITGFGGFAGSPAFC
jgi:hypothetical protein